MVEINYELREGVVATRRRNPCATLQQIGDKYGVSRERVRQLLESQGVQTRHHVAKKHCLECGKPFSGGRVRFCSRECQHNHTYPLIACDTCGKLFRRKASAYVASIVRGKKDTGAYCSKTCYGKWLGKNYGGNRKKVMV